MKIYLDKSALERLIGGNSEIEISIRNSIVQEFSKRYLKGLVTEQTEEIFAGELRECSKLIEKLIEEKIFLTRANLRPSIVNKINTEIDLEIGKRIFNACEEYKKKNLEKNIEWFEEWAKKVTEKSVESMVKERLSKIADNLSKNK